MDRCEEIRQLLLGMGYTEAGYLPKEKRVLMPEVLGMCEKNTCRCYGTNWACPPAHGSLEECRKRVESYENMLLFSKKYDLEDDLDYEGMVAGAADFRVIADKLHDELDKIMTGFEILTNGGCRKCAKCTYPDAPCRFPERLHPSLEGTGFMVSMIAKDAGMRYINGKDTVTYFGAILFN